MNKYYTMGWNAYNNGEDRWPVSHGLAMDSPEADAFNRGYEAASTKATESAGALLAAA